MTTYIYTVTRQQWQQIEQDKQSFRDGLKIKKFGKNYRVLPTSDGAAPFLERFLIGRGFETKLRNGLFVRGDGAEIQKNVDDFFQKWLEMDAEDAEKRLHKRKAYA